MAQATAATIENSSKVVGASSELRAYVDRALLCKTRRLTRSQRPVQRRRQGAHVVTYARPCSRQGVGDWGDAAGAAHQWDASYTAMRHFQQQRRLRSRCAEGKRALYNARTQEEPDTSGRSRDLLRGEGAARRLRARGGEPGGEGGESASEEAESATEARRLRPSRVARLAAAALLLRGGKCSVSTLRESSDTLRGMPLPKLEAELRRAPAFHLERRLDRAMANLFTVVSLREVPVQVLDLNFSASSLPFSGVVEFVHDKGYGFISQAAATDAADAADTASLPAPHSRVFVPPPKAQQFSSGDKVVFSMGLDAQGRPRAHDVRHLTAHHSAAPLFPPLNDQTEAAQAIRSTLLYSYFVDKDTRSLVPADRHREWAASFCVDVSACALPLTLRKQVTLKRMQRIGLDLVVEALAARDMSAADFHVVCYRRTLANLMDATLDPGYVDWFAANTYDVTKQLMNVTFLVQVMDNGTLLIDEGFDDSKLLMNKDSFGRQFERACVPRDEGSIKLFQAYKLQVGKARVLVCTPPDAMDAREAPVEVKLRLPPLMQLTEREQFCKGLVDLKHELLGFGVKSKDSKQVVVSEIVQRDVPVGVELMEMYGSHLSNVLELIRKHATVPGSTYLLRRRQNHLTFSEVKRTSFCGVSQREDDHDDDC